MKPFVKVTFDFGDEIKEVKFTNKENIEELIDILTAAHEELEHRIQMKRIKNKERRERRKQKDDFSKVTSYTKALEALEKEDERTLTEMQEDLMKEYECIEKLYNNLPDCKFKSNLKPYLELAKMLLECMKK